MYLCSHTTFSYCDELAPLATDGIWFRRCLVWKGVWVLGNRHKSHTLCSTSGRTILAMVCIVCRLCSMYVSEWCSLFTNHALYMLPTPIATYWHTYHSILCMYVHCSVYSHYTGYIHTLSWVWYSHNCVLVTTQPDTVWHGTSAAISYLQQCGVRQVSYLQDDWVERREGRPLTLWHISQSAALPCAVQTWPPMTTHDQTWPPMTTHDQTWPHMTTNDHAWLYTHNYSWHEHKGVWLASRDTLKGCRLESWRRSWWAAAPGLPSSVCWVCRRLGGHRQTSLPIPTAQEGHTWRNNIHWKSKY